MTPEKREALRRLAEKATPGPWTSMHHGVFVGSVRDAVCHVSLTTGSYESEEANRDFIAAANPAVVLDLLTQLDDALFTVKEMERNREESINVTTRREYELTKERDALKAEVERLHEFASDFAEVAEAAVRHHELRVAGRQGQEVPFHGAFANLPPSSVADLRKFAQAARRVLTQAGGGN